MAYAAGAVGTISHRRSGHVGRDPSASSFLAYLDRKRGSFFTACKFLSFF